jgi:hypothetical protein
MRALACGGTVELLLTCRPAGGPMHEKPLSGITGRVPHRHARLRHDRKGTGPDGFGLDEGKVEGFAAGTLTSEDEARLAEEVAALLPLSWSLSPRAAERLSQVGERVGGGRRGLLEWLDAHPGAPRLTARLLALVDNLDRFSENTAVVDALRAHRERTSAPAELRDVLPPETNEESLADIAQRIEELLGEHRAPDATRLALAATEWLRGLAQDAAPDSPEAARMSELMAHLHTDITAADAAS